MDNYFIFNGRSSSDFNVWISGTDTFDIPERDIETVEIPGRNGELIIDNGRYKNIDINYPCFISNRHFVRDFQAFAAWLMSCSGYCRLEDTYHPEYYRMARIPAGIQPNPTARNLNGSFDVRFNAKPQKWLKSGEIPITCESGGMIGNPTYYEAEPVITFSVESFDNTSNQFSVTMGRGDITIYGNSDIVGNLLKIDSISHAVMYYSAGSWNPLDYESNGFPTILPGGSSITVTDAAVSGIEVQPGWWTV